MGKRYIMTLTSTFFIVVSFYIVFQTDCIDWYRYSHYNTIIYRFKLAQRRHQVFSGEQLIRIAESIQNNKKLSNFEKIDLVREITYQQVINNQYDLDITDVNKILFSPNSRTPKEAVANIINQMNLEHKGIKCAGTATILALLYRIIGYKTWVYDYGLGKSLSHAVTLVELNNKIYLQDAYFNYFFVNEKKKIIPLEEVFRRNKQRKRVFIADGKLMFRRNISDGGFEKQCPSIMVDFSSADKHKFKRILWETYHFNVFPCLIMKKKEAVKALLSHDNMDFDLKYLVNYPLWLTDMNTLLFYPLKNYKQNKIFVRLVRASNRSKISISKS